MRYKLHKNCANFVQRNDVANKGVSKMTGDILKEEIFAKKYSH